MSVISEVFRAFIWIILCLALALGLLVFALIYSGIRLAANKFAWKQVSFPAFKLAK